MKIKQTPHKCLKVTLTDLRINRGQLYVDTDGDLYLGARDDTLIGLSEAVCGLDYEQGEGIQKLSPAPRGTFIRLEQD